MAVDAADALAGGSSLLNTNCYISTCPLVHASSEDNVLIGLLSAYLLGPNSAFASFDFLKNKDAAFLGYGPKL